MSETPTFDEPTTQPPPEVFADVAPRSESRARYAFSVLVFPVVFGGAVVGTSWMFRAGYESAAAFLVPTLTAYAVVAVLERVVPFRGQWLRSYKDVHVDFGHMVVSGGITLEAMRPFMLAIAVAIAAAISGFYQPGYWPSGWPMALQLVLALVIGEFFLYWVHRLAHEWDFLWRFHAVHHSCPRLYFYNAVRFHPVDLAISNFAPFVPLVALGVGGELLTLFGTVSAVHGIFQHSNLPLRLGPLNWFFSMAELHRWHHSRVLEEANSNYGQNLIVWDLVFGTRYYPKDREPPVDVGLTDMPNFPMGYWGQLLSPLRWKHAQRR
jgi:sterol desaturase/sphingolipid hydroxylase (fatty acid hydroxylase superfamily)